MQALFAKTAGYKTYTIVVLALIYAALGYFKFHTLTTEQALQFIQVALTGAGIRAAIK